MWLNLQHQRNPEQARGGDAVEGLCVLPKSKRQKPIQSLVDYQKKSQPVDQLLGRHVLPEV